MTKIFTEIKMQSLLCITVILNNMFLSEKQTTNCTGFIGKLRYYLNIKIGRRICCISVNHYRLASVSRCKYFEAFKRVPCISTVRKSIENIFVYVFSDIKIAMLSYLRHPCRKNPCLIMK